MNLEINKEILLFLRKNDLNIEDYFVLLALYEENYEILNIYDNYSKDNRIFTYIYQKLHRTGLIEAGSGTNLFQIEFKGKNLIEDIKQL